MEIVGRNFRLRALFRGKIRMGLENDNLSISIRLLQMRKKI